MYNFEELAALTARAKADRARPSLIILESVIGKGAPSKQGTSGVHGSPLGEEEARKAKEALGIPLEVPFWVAPEAYAYFEAHRKTLEQEYQAWQARFEAWKEANPGVCPRALYVAQRQGQCTNWTCPLQSGRKKSRTRNASGKSWPRGVARRMAEPLGGSADLTSPNVTQLPPNADGTPLVLTKENPAGRYIHFGVREHGMAAIANGIALYGGLRPFVATFLVFADYLRPALRLSALMKVPVIYVLTHDAIYIGEDGPTHQPVDTLASLRAIPGLKVLRPADAEETAVARRIAMERLDARPSSYSRGRICPCWKRPIRTGPTPWRSAHMSCRIPNARRSVTLVRFGSEVSMAIAAADIVRAQRPKTAIRVVSIYRPASVLCGPRAGARRDSFAGFPGVCGRGRGRPGLGAHCAVRKHLFQSSASENPARRQGRGAPGLPAQLLRRWCSEVRMKHGHRAAP